MCELYAPLADEMIVVDTGSTDGTLSTTHPKLHLLPSVRFTKDTPRADFHFGEARNEAIEKAQGDWILSIDADYVIAEHEVARLRCFIESEEAKQWDVVNFIVDSGTTRVSQPLLTRRSCGIRYYGSCHEMMRIPHGARRLAESAIRFTHVRTDAAEGIKAYTEKRLHYIDLIRKAIEREPSDYREQYNLALEYCQLKRYDEVLRVTSEVLQNSNGYELHPKYVALLMWLRGIALFNTGDYRGGIGQVAMALPSDPDNVPATYMLAEMKRLTGDLDGAEPLFRKLITIEAPTGIFHRDYPEYRTAKAEEGLRLITEARRVAVSARG